MVRGIRNSRTLFDALLICGVAFVMLSLADYSVAGSSEYSGQCGDNVSYELNPDTGVLTITGTGEIYNYMDEDEPAPWYPYRGSIKSVYIGESVTSIGINDFSDCESLTSVAIPDSVTRIGTAAFCGCTSLTSIIIPDSVTSLGFAVFENCTSLTSVHLSESIDAIGDSMFNGCTSLSSVTIPNSIVRIGASAFKNCTALTSLVIPDSVEYLFEGAFEGCTNIKELTVPATINCSGSNYYRPIIPYFSDCTNIEKITFTGTGNWYPYEPTSIPGTPWQISKSTLTTVIISEGLTSVGDSMFDGCTSLTSITFPSTIRSIGTSVFNGDFYEADGVTKLEPTAADLAGFTFKKTDDKWVKQVSSPVESESEGPWIICILLAILVVGITLAIVYARKGKT